MVTQYMQRKIEAACDQHSCIFLADASMSKFSLHRGSIWKFLIFHNEASITTAVPESLDNGA